MRSLLTAAVMAFSVGSVQAQDGGADTLYLLCRVDDAAEVLLLIAPGEVRQNSGEGWGENLCAFEQTVCALSPSGVLTVSHPEIPNEAPAESIMLDTVGCAFRYVSGADEQSGRCGQVAEPRPRAQ